MANLLRDYENPTLDNLNAFLNSYSRGKSFGITIRSAILQYCYYADLPTKDSEGKDVLVFLKDTGRKKLESDITIEKATQIYKAFPEGIYKDVCAIQLKSSCRAIEALLLEGKNVRQDFNCYTVMIVQKGGMSRTIKLPLTFRAVFLKPRYKDKHYLFLPDECQSLSREVILRVWYHRIFQRYQRVWNKVLLNGEFGHYASHDIRRAVIRAIEGKYGLRMAQKVAGHRRFTTTLRYCVNEGLDTLGAIDSIFGKGK